MAYRTVSVSFWTDPKIEDDFTPEDKYFYLYLLTNPHTNICGCYELSTSSVIRDTGYNESTVFKMLERMTDVHGVINYNASTKEVLVKNWYKYNWTASPKLIKSVQEVAKHIKCEEFKAFVLSLVKELTENREQSTEYRVQSTDVSIGYKYPTDTVSKKRSKHNFKGRDIDFKALEEAVGIT